MDRYNITKIELDFLKRYFSDSGFAKVVDEFMEKYGNFQVSWVKIKPGEKWRFLDKTLEMPK